MTNRLFVASIAAAMFACSGSESDLTIQTAGLPDGKLGENYDAKIEVTGGVAPYTFAITAGDLPAGITFKVETGQLSGVAGEPGRRTITVHVKDAEQNEASRDLGLFIIPNPLTIATTRLNSGREGDPYDTTVRAMGGTPPYSFDLGGGALPMGLGINNRGGITGTPEESGEFRFTVRVTDAEFETAMLDITLSVIAALEIASTSIPQIVAGRALDFTLEARGGEPPYTWTLDGALPNGVTFDDASGRLTGSSTDLGQYPLTARVQDSEGFRKSALFELRVSDRFTYEVTPAHAFPPICTGTTASFTTVEIPITDSFAIEDIDVAVEISFNGNNRNTRLTLISPTGHPIVLCGDGVYRGRGNPGRVPGGIFCGGTNGFNKTYDDQGGQDDRPELPLAWLAGQNVQGSWRLEVGVSDPNCANTGTIDRVTLSIRDDRSTEDYMIVSGWSPNNRLGVPWLRITGTGRTVGEDQLFLSATRYGVGPNNIREAGKGDDVADPAALTWAWGQWDGARGQPNDHAVTADGHVTTGVSTGEGTLVVSGPGGFSETVIINVAPPSWVRQSRVY